jgi:hypothetical protein
MIKISLSYLCDQMHRDNLNCWVLLDGKNEISRQDNADCPIDQSVDALAQAVDQMSGDMLTVKASKTGKGAAVKTFFLNMGAGYRATNKSQAAQPVGAVHDSVYNELSELKAQLRANEVRDEMKKEIDALKQQISVIDPITKYVDLLAPHFAPAINSYVISKFGAPGATHLAGNPDDREERLAKAISDIMGIDANALETIEAIAQIAVESPDTYFTYRKMLVK